MKRWLNQRQSLTEYVNVAWFLRSEIRVSCSLILRMVCWEKVKQMDVTGKIQK